jgi:hypothetical protein
MGGLSATVLGFAAVLAVGVTVVFLIIIVRGHRRRVRAREEQNRALRYERLLFSLETLDVGLVGLTTAALQGRDQFARERVPRLAQVISAANRSGDEELRRLTDVVAACCDALSRATQEGDRVDWLVHQLVDAQREVYRRMETLLDQRSMDVA